jgi:hypothetical protein
LTKAEKYKKAYYEAISDPEVYEEELRTSNLDGFLQILSHCISYRRSNNSRHLAWSSSGGGIFEVSSWEANQE